MEGWYRWFDGFGNPQLNLPDNLFHLLKRCKLFSEAWASNQSLDGLMLEGDVDAVQSLVIFTQQLYEKYAELWSEFAVMEEAVVPNAQMSTTPHLAVAGLTLKLHVARKMWVTQPLPGGLKEIWLHSTWPGILVTTTPHDTLFREVPPEGSYRAFHARVGNEDSLGRVLFTSFEESAFFVYERNLMLYHLEKILKQNASEDEETLETTEIDEEDKAVAADYAAVEQSDGEEDDTDSGSSEDENDNEDEGGNEDGGDKELFDLIEAANETKVDDVFPALSFSSSSSSSAHPSARHYTSTTPSPLQSKSHIQSQSPSQTQSQSQSQTQTKSHKRNNGKLLSMSAHRTSDLTKQVMQTVYFIIGSALYSTLELMLYRGEQSNDLAAARLRDKLLREKLTYADGAKGAKADNLPYRLVELRTKLNLLYCRTQLYDIALEMEKTVLIPLLEEGKLFACLGNRMSAYLECELSSREFPERIAAIFEVALGLVKPETELTEERLRFLAENLDYAPVIMAQKLYRYYVGSAFNDFMRHKTRVMKLDRDFKRNIAFRTANLTRKVVKTDTATKKGKTK
jgi:hypothetical protein